MKTAGDGEDFLEIDELAQLQELIDPAMPGGYVLWRLIQSFIEAVLKSIGDLEAGS